jgi:hypothetical protein
VKFVRRILVLALCVGAFGCAREEGARPGGGETAMAAGSPGAQALAVEGTAGAAAMAGSTGTQLTRHVQGFASLPDRGELLAYRKDAARTRGPYTWYRADVSEAHALAAIASGHLRVPTPDGKLLDFKYDRHVEHASGDWTWIGHLAGNKAVQTVLTFGAEAAFGSIGQPDQRPLRMTVRDGHSWMVATDAAKLAKIVGRYTAGRDYLVVPAPRGGSGGDRGRVRAGALAPRGQQANAAGTVVDVLVGYSPGFVTAMGGQSGALTRINFLVDYTNQAYANSEDSTARLGRVRLVGTMQVNYADNTDNTDTLEKLSGYNSASGMERTPDPAFQALRAARETLGADLVSFVHDFRTPENDSCGVAWMLGGGKQGIDPNDGWDYLGYSVVSDGQDVDEGDGDNYFCEDHTFAHELGHNMGLAHDRDTSAGDDGTLDNPDDYGVSDYAFGYKLSHLSSRFYTIMAYGDSGQTSYNLFSNPRKTCDGVPCGVAKGQAGAADASLSLSETMPLIAGFRSSVVSTGAVARNDFNGDGRSDVFWRDFRGGGNIIWLGANSGTRQTMSAVSDLSWKPVATGDFDGDGKSDIAWRRASTGADVIWRSGNANTLLATSHVTDLDWEIVGAGDVSGDGKADLVWRNRSTGANVIWKSANSSTRQAVTTVPSANWRIAGVADFDGDGKADLFWRHVTLGTHTIWRSGNSSDTLSVATVSDLDWQLAGVGDFDGDGRADLIWRHRRTGSNLIWKGANAATTQSVTPVTDLRWNIVAIGDYDGDGADDLLWRHGTGGASVIWRSAKSSAQVSVTAVTNMDWQVFP